MKYSLPLITGAAFLWLAAGKAVAQNYTGADGPFPACQGCHSTASLPEYSQWINTAHAAAYDSASTVVQTTASCLECHSTGWDPALDNKGADDFVTVDPNTGTITIDDSDEFLKKVNVQCESCHGPTEFGMNHPPSIRIAAEVCGACHQEEHHPYIEEWQLSAHAISDTSEAVPASLLRSDPNCSGCHTAQGLIQFIGTTPEDTLNMEPDIPEPPGDEALPLVCAACHDPHNKIHEGQLRLPPADLCVKCHNPEDAQPPDFPHHSTSSMWDGIGAVELPGFTYVTQSVHQLVPPASTRKCVTCHLFTSPFEPGPPVIPAATGHTFEPRLEACGQSGCHSGGLDDFNYKGRQTTIDSLMTELQERLDNAVVDTPKDSLKFENALFNMRFAQSEGSRGVHNFNYANSILQSTITYVDTALNITAIEPIADTRAGIPRAFALKQNFPNPFNPVTSIQFDISRATHVKLIIYNALGQQVDMPVDRRLEPSSYTVQFEARNLPSGIYFYQLLTDQYRATKKMLLLK